MTFGYQNWGQWGKSTPDSNWGHGTGSYHNGGVEGAKFSNWYDNNLASKFDGQNYGSHGYGWGGDKSSGGTKGHVWGGSKGTGGTKGYGWGGDKDHGGTKGWNWGGDKDHGGTKGWNWGGDKGHGGTKGWNWGGDKDHGGTKGWGWGGDKGDRFCGTKGTPDNEPDPDVKTTLSFVLGDPNEITVDVTETPEGHLFFNLTQTNFADTPSDIDGIFFDLTDDSTLGSLNFYPDENSRDVTDIQADADGVSALPNGAGAGRSFDVGLQFGTVPDSSEGNITTTNFTLWSDDGPVTLDDVDLSAMRVIVDSDGPDGVVLGVGESLPAEMMDADDAEAGMDDIMSLMMPPETDDGEDASDSDDMDDLMV